jgi:hypothetical protein
MIAAGFGSASSFSKILENATPPDVEAVAGIDRLGALTTDRGALALPTAHARAI